jgi:hypothetical protein
MYFPVIGKCSFGGTETVLRSSSGVAFGGQSEILSMFVV